MKHLFSIHDSFANKVSYYHLVLLMASLPFDLFYSHLVLISFALHTLIHLDLRTAKPFFNRRTLALASVFLVTVISTAYSINRPEAFNQWGRQFTMLLIPVVLCFNPLNLRKYRGNLFTAFALVCTFTIVYLYADALVTIRHYHLPYRSLFSGAFTNHNFAEPLAIHATFFSMQIELAFTFLITLIIQSNNRYYKGFWAICAFILVCGLIQLSSKSVFISLLIIVNLAVPFFLLTGANRMRFITSSVSISAIILVLVLNQTALKDRYLNELKVDLSLNPARTTFDSRLARWHTALQIIAQSPVVGHGAGSEITLLHNAYYQNKLYNSFLNGLNAHNQYLSMLIKSGFTGLIIYVLTLLYGFVVSLKKRDLLFFSFLLIVATVSFSENLLDVDKGVFFYALFFSFFLFANEQTTNGKSCAAVSSGHRVPEPAIVYG